MFTKKTRQWLLLSAVTLICSSAFFLAPETSYAKWGDGGNSSNKKTVDVWDTPYGKRNKGVGMPVAIKFNPDVTTNQLNFYGKNKLFYEEYYRDLFHWYSIVPPSKPTNDQQNMEHMLENLQKDLGSGGAHLVSEKYSLNLKDGRQDPWTSTYHKNQGTTRILTGTYEGKYYEWRFLGYTPDGEPVGNPYFPDDFSTGGDNWNKKDWQTVDFDVTNSLLSRTDYDDYDLSTKKGWVKDYIFPVNPKLRHSNLSVDKDAEWYASRLSFRSNPDDTTAIAEGWHNYPDRVWSSSKRKYVNQAHYYYVTFVGKPPAKPNLRLVTYKVYDKVSGDLIGQFTRSASNSSDVTETSSIFKNSKGTVFEVIRGRKYTIEATVKNMNDQQGLSSHDTTHKPVTLDYMYAVNDTAFKTNEYDAEWNDGQGAKPTTTTASIKYGSSASFKFDMTVPYTADQYFKFASAIPIGFYVDGDNTNVDDDTSGLTFAVAKEDMAIKDQIDVIDLQGNAVSHVVPNQPYSLRFYVSRPLGSPVGDSKNPDDNPFATVDVKVTDNGTVKKQLVGVATATLNQGKTVEVIVPNAIIPKTSQLSIDAKIDDIHEAYGQNLANGNDGWIHRDVKTNVNISVANASATPSVITLPSGASTDKQSIAFNFTVTNSNVEKQTKSIPYVIKKGTTVLASGEVSVPPNVPTPETVYVPNVPVYKGDIDFTIEVNPTPRKWYEFVNGTSNPYKDNVDTATVSADNPKFPVCTVPNTQNTWKTTYTIYDWTGHTNKVYIKGYGWFYWDVVDTWKTSTKQVSHYEKYYIDKILFRSKLTDDKQGTQQGNSTTWINLLDPTYSSYGKVKAGYGFDLKVIARYETNVYTASPKPWTSGANGRAVSPSWTYTDVPNLVGMTMPFKDKSGSFVKYTLVGTRSGSWDNESQEYVMPLQNSKFAKDNKLNTNEIYVNETAKDGTYTIRIDSLPFYGNTGKPSTKKLLCDSKNIAVSILGSNTDDLKTHVTQ